MSVCMSVRCLYTKQMKIFPPNLHYLTTHIFTLRLEVKDHRSKVKVRVRFVVRVRVVGVGKNIFSYERLCYVIFEVQCHSA